MDEESVAYLGKIALMVALIGASAYCVVHGKDDAAEEARTIRHFVESFTEYK